MNYESGTVKNVHYGDVLIKFGDYINASETELPYISDDAKADKFKNSFLQDGDIIIADTAEDEAVGKCTEIQGSEGLKLLSGLHTIACRPKEKYGPMFLGYYINSPAYHNQLKPLMQGIKVTSISKSALQDTDMIMPQDIEEQEKIGEYFPNLDHLITLHQRKYFIIYNKLITWEQRKLGEVLKERTERAKGDEELLSVTIANGVIRQIDSEKRNTASEDRSNYKIVKKGDVPYNSMRMWQGAVGNSKYNGIVSPAYTILTPTPEANGKFFMELFKKKSTLQIFQRWSQGLTSDTWNLKYPILSSIQFAIPSVEEQEKIAEYFSSLDHLITLHRRAL